MVVGSLLQLRSVEPVLYQYALSVGAQWPCGCLACGPGFERLELVACKEHYRAVASFEPFTATRN